MISEEARITVISDEALMAEGICTILREAGYASLNSLTPADLHEIRDETDLFILAVSLPVQVILNKLKDLERPVILLCEMSADMLTSFMSPELHLSLLQPESSPQALLAAVAASLNGLTIWDSLYTGLVFRELKKRPKKQPELTEREKEVLGFIARGYSNRDIASYLAISDNTVKYFTNSIYMKLGVINRAEAVLEGIKKGIVPV
jgi:DNA-binding NarL/FixJ family response regulator